MQKDSRSAQGGTFMASSLLHLEMLFGKFYCSGAWILNNAPSTLAHRDDSKRILDTMPDLAELL
jgi:hypothetical protein